MALHSYSRLLAVTLALVLAAPAMATSATDPATRRAAFKQALQQVENGPLESSAAIVAEFSDHPLAGYLEYARLRRQLATTPGAPISAFIERHPGLPINASLRDQALAALAARQDWAGFRALYAGSEDPALRCSELISRQQAQPDPEWIAAALELWRSGQSRPKQCDAVFERLKESGQLTAERLLERIDLAATALNPGLMRHLARSLPATQAEPIRRHAEFLANPGSTGTRDWSNDARSRRIIELGLGQLARRDPDRAEALLAELQDRFELDAGQRGRIRNQIALWSAASYLPGSAQRFEQVPAAAWDERLHAWQVREALARGDDAAALAAITRMPAAQRGELRWRYFEARLRQRRGEAEAGGLFAALAGEPSYYGFLAAERLRAPYALCALDVDPAAAPALRQRVEAMPGFVRALELHAIERPIWARREWSALLPQLSEDERRMAVRLAAAAGWSDRGPVSLRSGEDLRYYPLRFPLAHREQIEAEAAKYGLDPAWIAALIRAESAWAPDARSHANARGLMQLLPSTAQQEARKRGLRDPGAAGLFDPVSNIRIGIAHLASMLEKHAGRPALATAAYNAGATPVARWLAQRPIDDIDLWIETIPYHETREYVARILAFGVIYDWRLHGSALPITVRAQGRSVAGNERLGFTCPTASSESA